MPTPELKQALRAAAVSNVEKDLPEVLMQMFDIPRTLAERILLALRMFEWRDAMHDFKYETIDNDVRKAIEVKVQAATRRISLRTLIERGGSCGVHVSKLVSENQAERVCVGCPKSLECVDEELSTPAKCQAGIGPVGAYLDTRPIKMNGDKVTVECDQPRGKLVLDAKDFNLP